MTLKLKIGVLGCASIARRSVIPAIQSVKGFEVIAVASRTSEKANEFAYEFGCKAVVGYQDILEIKDVDVIYMPLPTGLHQEWVIKALDAGKHVLVEKSIAMDYTSAQLMVAKARQKKLLIMENFMFIYHGQHTFVKKLIHEDEIGEIRCFRSSFGFPPLPKNNFRYNKSLGGGALLDAAAYTVRASQMFMGDKQDVKACTLSYNDTLGVDIFGGAFLENSDGVISELAFGFDNFYQCNYEIWGSKGRIEVDRAFTPGAEYIPTIILEKHGRLIKFRVDAENHFINILKEFRETVIHEKFDSKYVEIINQSRILQALRDKSNERS